MSKQDGPVRGIYHLTLMTKNYPASKAFYLAMGCDLVEEWEHATVGGERANFSGSLLSVGGGSHIELLPMSAADAPEHVRYLRHFSLQVDDADSAYVYAQTIGAKPHAVHAGWDGAPRIVQVGRTRSRVGFLKGPDGEVLEVLQPLAPADAVLPE